MSSDKSGRSSRMKFAHLGRSASQHDESLESEQKAERGGLLQRHLRGRMRAAKASSPLMASNDELQALSRAHARTSRDGMVRFLMYASLGACVGLIVAALEWVAIEVLLEQVVEAPFIVQAAAPVIGVALAVLIRRAGWNASSSTSDAYVQSFHSGSQPKLRSLFPKLGAAVATIGAGGAVGLEGPAIYAGSTLGQWLGRWRIKALGDRSARILLVAGAAAGVAAVFKAPATGVLFALEAPYRRDVARHALIPALVASATAYIAFVLVLGNERLLAVQAAEFSLTDEVLGALILGVLGGGTARSMAALFHWAKEQPGRRSLLVRLPVAGFTLAVCLAVSTALVDAPVSLGPGANVMADIVLDASVPLATIFALFAVRAIATSATLAAGGVGGVFIPLAIQGLLLGRIVEQVLDAPSNGLYPVIGLAAVLGAGYRTPLAAVMFVAETTGRAEFVIPALLATAVAQALMGEASVSIGQEGERQGSLERKLDRRVEHVAVTVAPVKPDDSLLEIVDRLESYGEVPAVPVWDGEYGGLLVLSDVAAALMEQGLDVTVAEIVRMVPTLHAGEPAIEAVKIMNERNLSAVAIVDDEDALVGIVTISSLAGLRDLS